MNSLSNEMINFTKINDNTVISKLGNALMVCTTEELLDLQKYLKSKSLTIAQLAATIAVSAEVGVLESANVNVVIINRDGVSALQLLKSLVVYTKTGIMETKKLIDNMPATILTNVRRAEGKAIMANLVNEFGSKLIIELKDC